MSATTRRHRRAMTLTEVALSAVMLAALVVTTAEMFTVLGRQHRAVEQRGWAMQTASSALARFTAQPWEAMTPQSAAAFKLADDEAAALPGLECSVSVSEAPGEPAGKRVEVRLSWEGAFGQDVAPVELATWVFREAGR